MSSVEIRLQYRYGRWNVGTVVTVPHHIANALCDSPSPAPDEKPWAVRTADEPGPAAPVKAAPVPEGDDLDGLTNPELRERLEALGLPTSGKKSELIERLQGAR